MADRTKRLTRLEQDELVKLCRNRSADTDDRYWACWRLGYEGSIASLDVILEMFDEDDGQLAWAAAIAIGALAPASDTEAVRAKLLATLNGDYRSETRQAAVYALGLLGCDIPGETAEALIRILLDQKEPPEFRGEAAETLRNADHPEKVASLIQATLDPEPEVRYFAAYALGYCADPRAEGPLKALLSDATELPGYGTIADEARDALELLRQTP